MRPNCLSCAGSLGLLFIVLLLPSATQAQGFCYMVDTEGQVINLDDLCQGEDRPSAVPSPDTSPTTDSDLIEPQQESASPEVRSYTIIGTPTAPESSESSTESSTELSTESSEAETDDPAVTPEELEEELEDEAESTDNPNPAIAIPEIEVPVIVVPSGSVSDDQ